MELELLGINKYEARAYEALLQLGKASAPEIAQESGVPYGRIYDTLNSLVSKGLVIIIPEKTKKFAPAPQDILEKLISERVAKISKLKEDLTKLKKIHVPSEEVVELVKGQRNFYKIVEKLPTPKRYIYDFKYTSEVRPAWVRKIRKAIRAGVDDKVLVRYMKKTEADVLKWKKLIPKLKQRKFEFDDFAGQIVDDCAVLLVMPKSGISILIRDEPFAKLMKKLFEAAWDVAKEI